MSKLELRYVSLKDISTNPWNPHGTTPEEMDALIESVCSKGVIDTPLVVEFDRPLHYEQQRLPSTDGYLVVDGEQRFTAAREAFMRGLYNESTIPVTVLGKLSEFTEAELAEVGQALNHKGRGSLEDVKKTGIITSWLTARRSVEEVAKAVGQRPEFLKNALATVQKLPKPVTTRPQGYQERKTLNVVLPFEDELAVDEFETLISRVMGQLSGVPTTKGSKRVTVVMEALRNYEKQLA